MKIRLGYVSIATSIDIHYSNHTYANYLKNDKLDEVILSNFNCLKEILKYNYKNNIHFYRLTADFIPLSTLLNFDYTNKYKDNYKEIKKYLKNIRLDIHANDYTILNSTRKEVVNNSIKNLKYYHKLLNNFGIKDKVIIIHIGSSTFGKENSIKRFINNFNKLPKYIKKDIVIENDDKTFTCKDTLDLCKKLNIRMVLDYHHYLCNKSDIDYKGIFDTWNNNPKIHFSTPKNNTKKELRSHHDYINCDDFISFLSNIKDLNYDIDIMLEAKKKDEALFKLVRELKYKTNYKFIDDTTFII